jgi:PIN domain nuclease of toxin-antitoxin system
MRLLLDTHAYVWWRASRRRLSRGARNAIEDREHVVYLSTASVWELAIKSHTKGWEQGRVLLLDIERQLEADSMAVLAISLGHAREAGSLPLVHRDPFDRMLIAQARVDGLQLISNEKLFDAYGVSRLW